MRNTRTQDLPPIGGFIPEPDAVIELGTSDEAYRAWDSAWASLYDSPADRAAMKLAEVA